MVLLDKDLGVLAEGVMEGRRIFNNTMKYVLMATSSNFGNMFSAAGVAGFSPSSRCCPPTYSSTICCTTPVSWRPHRPGLTPRHWRGPVALDTGIIRRSTSGFGSVSSIFDFLTFWVMLAVLHASHVEFRTGWFVESIATQTLVMDVIRTRRVPFFKSRPSWPMLVVPTGAALVGAVLPDTGLAHLLGFTPLPTTSSFCFSEWSWSTCCSSSWPRLASHRTPHARSPQRPPPTRSDWNGGSGAGLAVRGPSVSHHMEMVQRTERAESLRHGLGGRLDVKGDLGPKHKHLRSLSGPDSEQR